jgi:hypothetical protein
MYKFYSVADRTEVCSTLARIYLDVNISPSTKILDSHFERNELMNLIRLVENSISSSNLYSKPGCHTGSNFFDSQEYSSCRHFIIEIRSCMGC